TIGASVPVLQNVAQLLGNRPQFSVSLAGVMAYVPSSAPDDAQSAVWVDRSGAEQPTAMTGRTLTTPRLSPDGRRFAIIRGREASDGGADLWLHEMERGTSSRLTEDGGAFPVWTPDGRQLIFNKNGAESVFARALDGGVIDQRLFGGVKGGSRPFST